MCIICISTVTVASLLAPTQAPAETEYNQKNIQQYEFTNKACSKSMLNKVKNNTICLKNGKVYRWAIKKTTSPNPIKTKEPTPTPTPIASATPTPTATAVPKIEDVYNIPSELSDSIDLCKIKETNPRKSRGWDSEEAPIFSLPSGFPDVSPLTQRTGTVKWALIPIDFLDLTGDKNFRARVDEQMKLLSEWYSIVSEGKLKVEWVVLDKWVTLPGTSNDYKISFSDSPSRSPEIANFWKKAITESDKHFDFTNIQTVNFLLPENQTVVKESLQGFPWDKGLQGSVTNEGPISSFTIAGEIFFKPERELWSYWAHEFGHTIGIPHVGASRIPSAFQMMDIMGNQEGVTRELSGWLRFLSGWMPTERVFCQTSSKITKTEITLVPLSSQKNGIKMTIIPLSDNKALIIESRRTTKFSCKNPIISDGVLVYMYDGKLGHGEEFLKPIFPSGRDILRSSCLTPPSEDLLLHKGDKVTVEGITVEVVAHGNYDKIIVSKP
jgi:hypothetical protein